MFLDESNPAAYMRQLFTSFLSAMMRHANRDIVLCNTFVSPVLSPATVSITTKSIGDSEDLPICKTRKVSFSEIAWYKIAPVLSFTRGILYLTFELTKCILKHAYARGPIFLYVVIKWSIIFDTSVAGPSGLLWSVIFYCLKRVLHCYNSMRI